MSPGFGVLLSVMLLCSCDIAAQQELAGATVVRNVEGNVIVSSDVNRPFYFALLALSETYGWVIDYEDPIYTGPEIEDTTDPRWLKEHPDGRHVYSPASGAFSADLGRMGRGNPDEQDSVKKLLDLYNHTSSPGFYSMMRTTGGRVVITGRSRSQSPSGFVPPLSQQMLPSPDSETMSKALQELIARCGSAGGVPIEFGIGPTDPAATGEVAGYNGPITCREQLGRILAVLRVRSRYALLYDINRHAYYLSIVPAHRLVPGPDGKPTVVARH
jgi:hypothetical protein